LTDYYNFARVGVASLVYILQQLADVIFLNFPWKI